MGLPCSLRVSSRAGPMPDTTPVTSVMTTESIRMAGSIERSKNRDSPLMLTFDPKHMRFSWLGARQELWHNVPNVQPLGH